MLEILFLFATLATPASPVSKLDAVPYLGTTEPYFLGSGVAGGGGDVHGMWDFLIGPDYTSPNFISSEVLSVTIDGTRYLLAPEMHRARGSGVFFGSQTLGGCQLVVADFSRAGSPWVARLIRISNPSASKRLRVSFQATVTPSKTVVSLAQPDAIQITADKAVLCFGDETKNWATRTSLISFSDRCSAKAAGDHFDIATEARELAPGATLSTALYHLQHYDEGKPASVYVDGIWGRHPEEDLTQSLDEWKKWLDSGKHLKIPDAKARDVIEGSLVAVRMQQNRDGGTIAGARRYANSYIRDTHGGLRLLLATGHSAEAKRAIESIHHKWAVAGFIPNYWSMGSDSFLGRSFVNDSSEITGYFVLMVRDYYAVTKDRAFVDSVADSMKFAIDSQLDFMAKNQWRITFNGDETEQYCVREDGQEYGGFPAFSEWKPRSWSFPSSAIACASTQFYVDYLRLAGRESDAAGYELKLKSVRDAIDSTFLKPDSSPAVHSWSRNVDGTWPRSTVPNYGLIPLWAGARLNEGREKSDALAMTAYLDPKTGYLPTVPGVVNGFCGHNLGYLLYDLKKLGDPRAKAVYRTIMNSKLLGCWGTVSEFYGPQGTPNGHNFRVFESGINAEALVRYFAGP